MVYYSKIYKEYFYAFFKNGRGYYKFLNSKKIPTSKLYSLPAFAVKEHIREKKYKPIRRRYAQ